MLKAIKIDNFKSLKNTQITLSKNSFLIGMNGSGKTTFLQLIDFLSVISLGKIEQWLEKRQWGKKDLTFYHRQKFLIDIKVTFQLRQQSYIGTSNLNHNHFEKPKTLQHEQQVF